MSAPEIDLAGIRARAEKNAWRWWFAISPKTVIALCDEIERQAGELSRAVASIAGLTSRALAAEKRASELAKALRPFANSASQWKEERSYDGRLQGLRCSVGCREFDQAFRVLSEKEPSP